MTEEQKHNTYLLQRVDCNCNDCYFLVRDMDKYKSFDDLYKNANGQVTSPAHRINYGSCTKFNKPVSFIPNTCQIETQFCFIHRKDIK